MEHILFCYYGHDSMEWCITLFFNAAISVFNYLILFFFCSENNKVWVFTVVTYKDQKSIIAHKCYVLLKYLQFKSNFLGKMYANSYRKTKNEGFSMLITWKIGQSELKRFSSCVEKHPTETWMILNLDFFYSIYWT